MRNGVESDDFGLTEHRHTLRSVAVGPLYGVMLLARIFDEFLEKCLLVGGEIGHRTSWRAPGTDVKARAGPDRGQKAKPTEPKTPRRMPYCAAPTPMPEPSRST